MALSESNLLRLLHSTEDSFVERKTVGDHKDWTKIAVSFANTLLSDQQGVLFIGATNEGSIQAATSNLDTVQKTFSEKMSEVYPRVYYTTQIVSEHDKECLAVIVPGSTARPHFAGPAYVRDGSKSVAATSQQYDALIASRIGKVYELQKWVGKSVTLKVFSRQNGMAYVVHQFTNEARVIEANQFYTTVFFNNRNNSYPINRIDISYDDVAKRLELQVEDAPPPY